MTQQPDRLLQVLDGIATDLERIHADLAWTWSLGWDAPAQIKDQAHRGASLARPLDPDDPDSDHVPGAKHDTGQGDHRARTAARQAATHLRTAGRRLAAAIQTLQPDAELVLPGPPDELTLTYLDALRQLAAHRATSIRHTLNRCPRNQRPAGLEHQVLAAHTEIRATLGILAKVLDQGPLRTSQPDPDMCRICGIRPRAAKSDGRCSTCHSWFHRHGKRERPSALDAQAIEAAKQAQARRRARGEDYGATALPGHRPDPSVACATTGVALDQVEELRPSAPTYRCRPCRLGHYRACLAGRCTCDCETP